MVVPSKGNEKIPPPAQASTWYHDLFGTFEDMNKIVSGGAPTIVVYHHSKKHSKPLMEGEAEAADGKEEQRCGVSSLSTSSKDQLREDRSSARQEPEVGQQIQTSSLKSDRAALSKKKQFMSKQTESNEGDKMDRSGKPKSVKLSSNRNQHDGRSAKSEPANKSHRPISRHVKDPVLKIKEDENMARQRKDMHAKSPLVKAPTAYQSETDTVKSSKSRQSKKIPAVDQSETDTVKSSSNKSRQSRRSESTSKSRYSQNSNMKNTVSTEKKSESEGEPQVETSTVKSASTKSQYSRRSDSANKSQCSKRSKAKSITAPVGQDESKAEPTGKEIGNERQGGTCTAKSGSRSQCSRSRNSKSSRKSRQVSTKNALDAIFPANVRKSYKGDKKKPMIIHSGSSLISEESSTVTSNRSIGIIPSVSTEDAHLQSAINLIKNDASRGPKIKASAVKEKPDPIPTPTKNRDDVVGGNDQKSDKLGDANITSSMPNDQDDSVISNVSFIPWFSRSILMCLPFNPKKELENSENEDNNSETIFEIDALQTKQTLSSITADRIGHWNCLFGLSSLYSPHGMEKGNKIPDAKIPEDSRYQLSRDEKPTASEMKQNNIDISKNSGLEATMSSDAEAAAAYYDATTLGMYSQIVNNHGVETSSEYPKADGRTDTADKSQNPEINGTAFPRNMMQPKDRYSSTEYPNADGRTDAADKSQNTAAPEINGTALPRNMMQPKDRYSTQFDEYSTSRSQTKTQKSGPEETKSTGDWSLQIKSAGTRSDDGSTTMKTAKCADPKSLPRVQARKSESSSIKSKMTGTSKKSKIIEAQNLGQLSDAFDDNLDKSEVHVAESAAPRKDTGALGGSPRIHGSNDNGNNDRTKIGVDVPENAWIKDSDVSETSSRLKGIETLQSRESISIASKRSASSKTTGPTKNTQNNVSSRKIGKSEEREDSTAKERTDGPISSSGTQSKKSLQMSEGDSVVSSKSGRKTSSSKNSKAKQCEDKKRKENTSPEDGQRRRTDKVSTSTSMNARSDKDRMLEPNKPPRVRKLKNLFEKLSNDAGSSRGKHGGETAASALAAVDEKQQVRDDERSVATGKSSRSKASTRNSSKRSNSVVSSLFRRRKSPCDHESDAFLSSGVSVGVSVLTYPTIADSEMTELNDGDKELQDLLSLGQEMISSDNETTTSLSFDENDLKLVTSPSSCTDKVSHGTEKSFNRKKRDQNKSKQRRQA